MPLERRDRDYSAKPVALLLIGKCCVEDTELSPLLQCFAWTDVDRADTDADGLAFLRMRPRQVILLDSNVPALGGLVFLRNMRRQNLAAQVLMRGQEANTTDILRALRAGAAGYLRQTAPVDELIQAVRRVAGGKYYFEPDVAQSLALQVVDNLRRSPLAARLP
jgi:DNA-binding NarL/FixJ family response regulator